MRILEVGSVSIARVLYQRRRRRKELGITGPSRSSPWGIQRGKEIPETMKTGTKHQNKTKTTEKKKKKKQKKKRKVVNTKRTKEKTHAEKKSFSIFMPKLTEHNCKNQDPYSNQACLSKYRNFKERNTIC